MGAISEWTGLRWPVAGGAMIALVIYAWYFRKLSKISGSLEGG